MTVQELFQEISKRPAMYLGEATLTRFDAFLLGWMFESEDPNTSAVMSGFQAWVSDRYKITSSHSWANIIRFYAQDDVSALNDAFKLFNEYLETTEATTTTP